MNCKGNDGRKRDAEKRTDMKIRKSDRDGNLKIHLEDSDGYELTADNGIDIWFTPEQVKKISEYRGT